MGKLVKKYVETYPNIEVLGHNQIANKPCPWFNVPYFCRRLKIPNSNIWGYREHGLDFNSVNQGLRPDSKWKGNTFYNELGS